MADRKWFADHLAERRRRSTDRTDEISTIGLWGPRARDILASLTADDVSDEGFGFLTCREITVSTAQGVGTTVLASRISYVGELGWELYVADGATPPQLWEALLEAGAAARRRTGRHRRLRHHRPDREGLPRLRLRARRASAPSSRPACSGRRSRPPTSSARRPTSPSARRTPQTVLCTLTVDDHTSACGEKRYMLGGEPILTRDGGTLTDGHGHHPYVTTAGSAPSPGQARAAGLPAAGRRRPIGNELAVSYMEELYPVTVGSVDATPLLDPDERADRGDMTERPGLRQAGRRTPPSEVRADRRRARPSTAGYAGFTTSAHEECAVELAVQVRRAPTGHGDRAHARRRRTPSSSCAPRWPSAARRRPTSSPTRRRFGPADVAPRDRRRRRVHEADGTQPRPGAARQRRRRHAATSRSAIRLAYELGVAGRQRRQDGRGRRRRRRPRAATAPDGHETYRVPLPAVVTVLEGGVEPRYPTRPGPDEGQEGRRSRSAQPAAEPAGAGRVRLRCRRPRRRTCRSSARAPEAAPAVVDLLRAAGGAGPMILVLVETDADRRGRRGVAARPSPSPATSPPSGGGRPGRRASSSATVPDDLAASSSAAYGVAHACTASAATTFASYSGAGWASAILTVRGAGGLGRRDGRRHAARQRGDGPRRRPRSASRWPPTSLSFARPVAVRRHPPGGRRRGAGGDAAARERPAVFTVAGHAVEAAPAARVAGPAEVVEHTPEVAAADLVARVVSSEEPERRTCPAA